MVSAPRHYKGELLLETPESLWGLPGNCESYANICRSSLFCNPSGNMASEYKIATLIRSGNNLTLESAEQASDSFLQTLLGVLRNAQWWHWIKKVYLECGFTGLRRGIDGLARIIRFQFQLLFGIDTNSSKHLSGHLAEEAFNRKCKIIRRIALP